MSFLSVAKRYYQTEIMPGMQFSAREDASSISRRASSVDQLQYS